MAHALWIELASAAGLALTQEQLAGLERFLELLLQANQRLNLTRIIDPQSAAILHVADALTLLPHLPKEAHLLADVGSGGGVPGLILAIARLDATVSLFEATRKKAVFLRQAVSALGLGNTTVFDCRAEQSGRTGAFDVITARAVGPLARLVEWALPLLKPGGKLLAMKGQKLADELPEARRLLARHRASSPVIHPAPLPGGEHHVIVEIRRGTG